MKRKKINVIEWLNLNKKISAENRLFELKVFYTWGEESIKPKYDPDFGRVVEWDIPLLQGYQYQFVKNGNDALAVWLITGG